MKIVHPESQPLVSVVTPVYNGEKYLAECIESVLAQTYENWEYVIVNNCSTDRSLEIAQQYAERDARIRIHNNAQFLPAIQNFNHAFLQISPESKYCKVVHADDWLFPECIAQMVNVAEANPSVGIVSSYVLEGIRVKHDELPYPSTVIPGREICRLSLLTSKYVFGSPTSLLIRSDLIRGRKTFYDESLFETADQEVCYHLLRNTDFGFVHQVLTFTRVHSESRTSHSQRLNRLILEQLVILKRYGPVYLSREEYERRLAQKMQNYYAFLGKSVFQRRDKEFWNYHKKGLENLGLPLDWAKLVRASIREMYLTLMGYLSHPRNTAQSMVLRLVRKDTN